MRIPSLQVRRGASRFRSFAAWLPVLWLFAVGCARGPAVGHRPFAFPADVLSITNETEWVYAPDPVTGRMRHTDREPEPTYTLRCFVLARTAKQFHAHAEFRPELAALDQSGYRRVIREVLGRSPRSRSEAGARVVVPGYADLHGFSAAFPELFQAECGGAWLSYVQRGNWRMVLPFSRSGQAAEAGDLAAAVRSNRAPVVHLTDFPTLHVNHAVLLYAVAETPAGLEFLAYDPNQPNRPLALRFERANRQFHLAPTVYFLGGPIDAYEVYRSFWR